MYNHQNLQNFNQLQTAIYLSQGRLPKNIMGLILHYALTPTRFETIIDTIDFLLSLAFAQDKTKLNNIKTNLQVMFKNPELTSEAADSSIKDAMNLMTNAIKNHKDEILFKALKTSTEDVIHMILGLPVEFNLNAKNNFGLTSLMIAAEKGHKEIVALLLENGANINERNYSGWTALMFSTKNGHKETVALLLEKDANINPKSHHGKSALMIAAHHGHKEIAALLLNNDQNINQKNNDGCTALLFASLIGHKEIVALLLGKGADINEKNNDRWTPLMIAARHGHNEVVELLLENGANINEKKNDGQIALEVAPWIGATETVGLLIKSHKEQFYTQTIHGTPEVLAQSLNEQPSRANINRDTMCAYLLRLVDKETIIEQKIALLEGALGNNAFGALMKQSDFFSWHRTSSAVTKIERAKAYYKPSIYVAGKSRFTVQYTCPRNIQQKYRLGFHNSL